MGGSSSSMAASNQWNLSMLLGSTIGYYVGETYIVDLGAKAGFATAGPAGAIIGATGGLVLAIVLPRCSKMVWATLRFTARSIRKIINSATDFVEHLTNKIASVIVQHKPFPICDATPPTNRRMQQQQSTHSTQMPSRDGQYNSSRRKNDASYKQEDSEDESDFSTDDEDGSSESLSLPELIRLLQEILSQIANRNGNRKNLYVSLIEVLRRLIHNFGATMEYHPR